MKKLYYSLFIFSLIACSNTIVFSQSTSMNQEVESNGHKKLLGPINRQGLTKEPYSSWFNNSSENYTVKEDPLKDINAKDLKDLKIQAFMGTWCGDSKRGIPKFYKTLDALNFPEGKLEVIAVDNGPTAYKQSPSHEEDGLGIHRVPMIIIYKKGKEIGRIAESPVKSWEEDIATIIKGGSYNPNYKVAYEIYLSLKKKGAKWVEKKASTLAEKYKEEVESRYELNTYGRVLLADGKTEEAIAVYKVNSLIFPDWPEASKQLERAYEKSSKN
ncbi:thioredoxin family protein [Xanthovirga aplysinae]|uniref:thioredoxin family protein n=1 Tax=Xanthovirga aplysinae TaxID=2529853 RepID=UPI0012BBE466|nr:thioredoxin family protein [Xanthovirga aplysinae]MTI33641.1 thioredoxin [Xanthovirga aplysinae]